MLPVLSLTALFLAVIWKENPIFRQLRVGYRGELFSIFKLRSIPSGHRPVPQWTRALGLMLRESCLDEVPQLLNIIQNKMAFVGPRPLMVKEVKCLQKSQAGFDDRFRVLPGMTGLAQVRVGIYRMRTAHETVRHRYDLHYVKSASFLKDLWILLLTPVSVASRFRLALERGRGTVNFVENRSGAHLSGHRMFQSRALAFEK